MANAATSLHPNDVKTPAELSARTWWRVIIDTANGIGQNNLTLIAAGMAFYMMLALFPMIGALGALYGLIADPADLNTHMGALAAIAPAEAAEIVRGQVAKVAAASPDTLSLGAGLGAAFAVLSARGGVNAAITGLNITYQIEERRSFLATAVLSIVLTFALLVVGVVALATVVAAPVVLSTVPLGAWQAKLVDVIRWPVGIAATMFGIGLLYRNGPARRHPRIAWITPGALLATVGWLAGSAAISYYIANFAGYNETYGSLGAVIGMLMWFFLTSFVILIGAQLNAELERRAPSRTET